jgi:hypothetical protein
MFLKLKLLNKLLNKLFNILFYLFKISLKFAKSLFTLTSF